MTTPNINYNDLRNLTIGTVESVSPSEIRVLLDLNAPQNTALNTGTPTLFPKINGYVLLPNEAGARIGMISWIGIEHSPYPKRKGFKDFDLVDLPFPLRKISISPLGILKKDEKGYRIERGVYSYPSVGDAVVIPTHEQLQSIVENKDENAKIKIGNSPHAANAPVYVDPDKLFGRHVAVLGNTGSGKSCTVAGLIRWSMEAVKNEMEPDKKPNARFLILDPNGEYTKSFNGLSGKVRIFKVDFDNKNTEFEQLKVPAWMWNSYEWNSITQASGKTQRPILRRALRELKNGNTDNCEDEQLKLRRYLSSNLVSLKRTLNYGDYKTEATKFGFLLKSISEDLSHKKIIDIDITTAITEASERLSKIINQRYKTFIDRNTNKKVEYYVAFEENDVEESINSIENIIDKVGGILQYKGPDEDSPVYFKGEDLPNHLERLAQEQNVQQFLDFLIMRVRTMLSDTRMSSIIGTETDISLVDWLEKYLGKNNAENGEITVVDLSLVPPDIIHIVVAVMARIVFEALQRYKRKYTKLLPTVLVMEEAHNFISRYNTENEEFSPSRLCSQSFEKIAKEGRKFGLGLLLSSQRPSELSPTVLSQCNTFLLHRLVNDRDQELVKRFVPDNLGNILNELPVLPTKKAILLGWAAPVPILVDINELKKEHRPDSKDPDFWDVWTGKEKREIDWNQIVEEWQNEGDNEENK